MADPGTEAIMIDGIDDGDFRAHLLRAVDELSALSGVNVLAGKRREEPCRAFEKIGVGKLHTGVFFARHGMPGKESLTGVSSARFRGTLPNFHFHAPNPRYECLDRPHWPVPPLQT